MLLAIDIGNSLTKFGVFESASLIDKFAIPTTRDLSVKELLFDRLKHINERFFSIDTVVVCSVVPEVNETFLKAVKELLSVTPVFVDHSFDFGLQIKYEPVNALGLDRMVNSSAAASKYGTPVIACSFGTATTIDVVSSDRQFLGGVIAPGMKLVADALHLKTAQLPNVAVKEPSNIIGTTTESSIMSGVFYGYIGLVEGLLERMFSEIGSRPDVVATGGFASIIARHSHCLNIVDEELTLEGLRMLMEQNDPRRS